MCPMVIAGKARHRFGTAGRLTLQIIIKGAIVFLVGKSVAGAKSLDLACHVVPRRGASRRGAS